MSLQYKTLLINNGNKIMNINLSLCHKWARIAYAQQLQSIHSMGNHTFQYDATYKDYVCYAMKHFNLVKSYFNKLALKQFIKSLVCFVGILFDTFLYCLVGIIVAFVLLLLASSLTWWFTYYLCIAFVILISGCNIFFIYDNIRNKVNKFNEFNKIKGY